MIASTYLFTIFAAFAMTASAVNPHKSPVSHKSLINSPKSLTPASASAPAPAPSQFPPPSQSPAPAPSPPVAFVGMGVAGPCKDDSSCDEGLKCKRLDTQDPGSDGICTVPKGKVVDLGAKCGGFSRSAPQCANGLTCKLGPVSDGGGVCALPSGATLSTEQSGSNSTASANEHHGPDHPADPKGNDTKSDTSEHPIYSEPTLSGSTALVSGSVFKILSMLAAVLLAI
ncbi:hypothetical protein BATDEDRAFT_27818 [Batrachochytrium dendrobatidis JAM81]|uniref:IGFBP N-terminal domain-containing protein n=1 Tax=Batrachochytrium dendrobatidis (strain JAM81 / FGSC 10211) TaxID=684364 RepID=F4PC70_BATDJ|nr:uncharacterized protein BATDEDRAFT_27818 [Batrachochytrium dendrobatidis JAM81]EGF77170.1 hypothetical protein BATDEDRAFT_27818 [Batrachochytrium dendrobatidis JAM81]KAJ8330371.1 hypothetical protein O5D80_001370 [Batrachochytrium dendrobatidis]KAK5665357.1 hypothetical protein QVD99_007713 [Batrachochytrium dendrobatidis]|eukprot:XP_006682171.1 hypothetical protein BATDEDRAFT_27818 [Batrachochytrium dendrobatidis JAM81]